MLDLPEGIDLFAARGMHGQIRSIADRIDATGPCWLWTGVTNRGGYGQVEMWPHGTKGVHRVVYEALVGPIGDGLQLDHLCRVRHCVNPDHLEPVTAKENARRGIRAKMSRTQTHCKRGHAFTDDNTYRKPNGRRGCRLCRTLSMRRVRERKRARRETVGVA